jgi:hypothetical protein
MGFTDARTFIASRWQRIQQIHQKAQKPHESGEWAHENGPKAEREE